MLDRGNRFGHDMDSSIGVCVLVGNITQRYLRKSG
jgi:hypothetical protein